MEVTAVVLYGGALAHYDVRVGKTGECYAQLSSYNGNPSQTPPREMVLKKQGRHWVSDNGELALSDELGYAVELKAKPILETRKRGGHPAGQ